jgi:hypothetical protein
MFERRSKTAFLAWVFAGAYSLYSVVYWSGVAVETQGADAAEAFGAGLATLLVLPHVILAVVGSLFGAIGFFSRSPAFILTSAILYSVSALLFLVYAVFLVPSIVLGFVGFAKQRKIKQAGTQ